MRLLLRLRQKAKAELPLFFMVYSPLVSSLVISNEKPKQERGGVGAAADPLSCF
jgi:hypothetical protein